MFRHDYRPVCWQLQLQHEQERNLHPAVHADGRGGPIVVRACVSVLWPLEQTARTGLVVLGVAKSLHYASMLRRVSLCE